MSEQPLPGDHRHLRASDGDREQVARILHAAMGEGRITLSELEERLEAVYAAKTFADLEPITADLPVTGPLVVNQPRALAAPHDRVGGTPSSAFALAVMWGSERKGRWVVPSQFTALALMGGVELDLTRARFATREVTITCVAMMGCIDVIVPEDITVHVSGIGLMGGFEDKTWSDGPADGVVVRINGLAMMGGVEVRHPKKKRKQLDPPAG